MATHPTTPDTAPLAIAAQVDDEQAADEQVQNVAFKIPPNWPMCDPSYVLEMLHLLKEDKCYQGRVYFSTYTKVWAKLAEDRKMKTRKFFTNQSVGVQIAIANGAIALEAAKQLEIAERSSNTTKDRCR